MIVLAILAASSAWLVTREAPQHRPLALALTVCAGLDAARLLGLPPRVDMALCLGAPAVSVWAYILVWNRHKTSAARMINAIFSALTVWGISVAHMLFGGAWEDLTLTAYFGPLTATCLYASEMWRPKYWTISQRVALILLAGDALAVASLCAREWISNQAGVVLAAVTVYQVTWWWRWRCE